MLVGVSVWKLISLDNVWGVRLRLFVVRTIIRGLTGVVVETLVSNVLLIMLISLSF